MTEQDKSKAFDGLAPKLYDISDDSFRSVNTMRRMRNWFLASSVVVEAGLGIAKLAGANFKPGTFIIGAYILTLAGGAEIGRRVELSTGNNIRDGAREIQDLDFLVNPKWEEGIQPESPPPDDSI
jgi:hypothetical protein